MDRLLLEDVRFYGHHGVTPAEQALGVWFSVDVELAWIWPLQPCRTTWAPPSTTAAWPGASWSWAGTAE